MNFFCVITMVLLMDLALDAQTNSVAPTNAAPRVTHIDSDNADFDLNARTAIYRGDVHVTDPQMKMTCLWLVADLPEAGHINRIVAETNVVIDFIDDKGEKRHATGDKAVYNYSEANGATNETVTLTGKNPEVTDAQSNVMIADVIIWDRIQNRFHFQNPHATIQNPESLTKTNSAPDTIQFPLKTNLPGTIENIDKVLPQTQNAP